MKIAVVTGTSYGLGKSIAEMLLGNSFKVYGISRTKSPIKNTNFVWLKADLYKEVDIAALESKISEQKIDLLVNNAGTAFEEPALDITRESLYKMFNLNFLAPIFMARIFLKKLEDGLIINISSDSDRFTDVNSGLYSASKAALNIFYDALVVENKTLKVFNLLPSYIDTPLQHDLSDTLGDFDWEACMLPKDVAESVKYLFDNRNTLSNSIRVIVVNNELIGDIEDPEKLYYYNVDTQEFKKLK